MAYLIFMLMSYWFGTCVKGSFVLHDAASHMSNMMIAQTLLLDPGDRLVLLVSIVFPATSQPLCLLIHGV